MWHYNRKINEGCCTLIEGSYTITDRAVLGKFEPNTTYYGLLCSGFSDGSGSWYTSVSIDVRINENRSFVILDEETKPEISVTSNHNPVRDGDVLTATTNADEITFKWYYDDNEDGIPDEGTLLGSGENYTVKCPDTNDPTHDDTGHKIICVAIQDKDESGNPLSEELKIKQVSEAIAVREKFKDVSSTATATQKDEEILVYDGTTKKPSIIVKSEYDILAEGLDYDIEYVGIDSTNYGPTTVAPTEIGKYKAVIKFKGYCIGSDKEVDFSIIKPGSINIKLPKDSNIIKTRLELSNAELLNKIEFTEEELIKIQNGKNISVYLEIKNINNIISEDEKEKIETNLSKNQKIDCYLDISLFKKIEGEEPIKITNTKEPIAITFEIPENLVNTDSNINRTYKILRLHDGVVTEIEVEVDGTFGKFETDGFSTYALTYTDKEVNLNNPKTGDTFVIWISLMLVSILGIVGTLKSVNKTE